MIVVVALLFTAHVDETVVREQRVQDVTTSKVSADDGVLALPGVSVARDGGPLSPWRATLRGLSGARLKVDVMGVAINDPATGFVDFAMLPTALGVVGATTDDAFAGTIGVGTAAGSRLRLVAGELNTLSGSGRVVVPVDAGRATFAIDAGTTRGDFAFAAPDGSTLVRSNNDHQRINAIASVDTRTPIWSGQLHTTAMAFGAAHRGGVPGFFTAPLTLRQQNLLGAVAGGVAYREGTRVLSTMVNATGSDRSVDARHVVSHGAQASIGVSDALTIDAVRLVGDAHVDAGAATVVDAADRFSGEAGASAAAFFPAILGVVPSLRVRADVGAINDVDDVDSDSNVVLWLPRIAMQATVARDAWRAFVVVRHAQRAPTLDERFAPAGFIEGTPDLLPERDTLAELGAALTLPQVRARASAWASRLDEAIVVVNHNAFVVAPQNTGPASRAGVELLAGYAPHALVAVDITASLLWSHVDATAAPLPTAPPWSLRAALTVGDDDAHIRVIGTGRGASPSTIFGTLPSVPTLLWDMRARMPLTTTLGVTVAVDNAADVRSATDQNLLPLPGRLIFVGLEVRS